MINTSYKSFLFYQKMDERYKRSFDKLAEVYGEELNSQNINAGNSLFTLHNFDHHCYNIYKIIDKFFSNSLDFFIVNNNTKYIFKLYLSVLFHDIGMTDFNLDRNSHSKRSAEEVERLWNNSDSALHKERIGNILDGNDIDEIKLIILAHSDIKDDTVLDDDNGLLNPKFDKYNEIVKVLAGILRIADEFDCDETRLGIESRLNQLNTADPAQMFSKECWEKLKCIKKLEYAKSNTRVILLRLNNEFVCVQGKQKVIYEKYLPEILFKVQKELDYVNNNVFNKDFCINLAFKAEKVLYFREDLVNEMDDNLLYPITFHPSPSPKSIPSSIKKNSTPKSSSSNVTLTADEVLKMDSFFNRDLFWGKGGKPSFFYNYASNSHQYVIGLPTLNSLNEYIQADKLDDWIRINWFNNKDSFIHLLIGYAGCGKTTFVNYILKRQNTIRYLSYWDFYETQHIIGVTQSVGLSLYLKDNLVKSIKEHLTKSRNPKALLTKFKNNLLHFKNITSFSIDTQAMISSLEECYKEKNKLDEFDIKDEFIAKPADALNQAVLLGLTFIWNSSISKSSNPMVCVFDGLDIIESPQILVDFIHNVYLILNKYRSLTQMTTIKAVFTCRKFTYSLLETSRGDVSFSERNFGYRNSVSILDISNLYQVNKVLTYKAGVAYENSNMFNLNAADINECKRISCLTGKKIAILDTNSKINDSFSLSKIVNHNLRSAVLLFHAFFENEADTYDSVNTSFEQKCYIGYFVHKICYELNDKGIWVNMGYGGDDELCTCERSTRRSIPLYDEQIEIFPTTLSRMILTLLYRHEKEMSLKEIYGCLKWIPYQNIKKGEDINVIQPNENECLSIELFAECIADMLNRSSSNNDEITKEGIWRRPLYFGSRALIPPNILEKKQYFIDQFIKLLNNTSFQTPTFKISECGEEFIDTIAIHFEFNAVRFGNTDKPLWMLKDENNIKCILDKVYSSVSRCMDKQVWLENYFSRTHSVNYLNEEFHPITKWEQRPQLHIIRVIFSHILYLDSIRTLLWKEGECNVTSKNIISTLNNGIGNYLDLLETNLQKFNTDVSKDIAICKNIKATYKYVVENASDNNPYVKSISINKPLVAQS